MPRIKFFPSGITAEAAEGEPLREAAARAGIEIEAPCGGEGTCGKCLVKIISGKLKTNGDFAFPPKKREAGFALACRASVCDVDAEVEIFSAGGDGRFAEDEISEFVPPDEVSFLIKTLTLAVREPKAGDGFSDFDRLVSAVKNFVSFDGLRIPLPVLSALPETLRASRTHTLVYYIESGILQIVDLLPRDEIDFYGIAVDVGSTTVAACLVDKNGKAVAARSEYNGQIICGADVISRINYARKGLHELRQKIVETINALINSLCEESGADPSQIYHFSVAANTTMVHLLLGINPEYIRLEPYVPAVYDPPLLTAGELGLSANAAAPVYFAPSVGSYVGGDITSGLLRLPPQSADEVNLFIDIGTNGEVVLCGGDFLIACACSAGPAFEGGGISCGMRAASGAVESVEIDARTGEPRFSVIGGEAPKGICGSGMISLAAELYRKGFLEPNGKFSGESKYIREKKYFLSENIFITEQDMQNFIRAKAAVFSACRTLLSGVGLSFGDLKNIFIAGGFGRYLNLGDAAEIGLIPPLPCEKYVYLSNSSLAGAYMTLVSENNRRLQAEIAKKITYTDLSAEPSYMDEYTAALFLPHTDGGLFKKN